MKILQVNTVLSGASTGRIMTDLYHTIEAAGDEAYVAVGRQPWSEEYKGMLIGNKADFYQHVARNFLLGEGGFGSQQTTYAFLKYVKELQPDIVHLHNIHGFYLQVEQLFAFFKKYNIKVVWTLHDCWTFTGHCAYYDYAACDKWKAGCSDCIHHAKVYPYALFKDNSVDSYRRKHIAFCGVEHLTIVTPCQWLKGQLQESFLKEYPVRVIYNGVDTTVFTPETRGTDEIGSSDTTVDCHASALADGHAPATADDHASGTIDEPSTATTSSDKASISNASSLSNRKYIILGVAAVWEHRKGLRYFEKLAADLPDNYEIRLIGLNKKQIRTLKKKYPKGKLIPLPKTNNIEELAQAYRDADVFVNPTLEDNFPTTNIEALNCGTPVITYATGGSGEALDDTCGIVVFKGNYTALKDAVIRVCEETPFTAEACRARGLLFDKNQRYKEYLELYHEMMENNP